LAKEATFVEHLKELRRRIIVSAAAVLLGAVAGFVLFDWIFAFFAEPFENLSQTLDSTMFVNTIFEGFAVKMKLSIISGTVLSLPVHLYNIIAFVFPGLLPKERRIVGATLAASFTLAILAFYYGYFHMIPISIRFLTGMGFIPDQVGILLGYGKNIFYVLQLLFLLILLVQLPVVQNWLIQKVTASISEKIKAEVSIGHIEIRFFTNMNLENFLVKDQAGDTLLYAKSLNMGITNFQPFKKRIFLSSVYLDNPIIHLYRTPENEEFNFQFIMDHLSVPKTDKETEPYDIKFEDVYFSNLDFRMDDSLTQKSMHIAFSQLGIESEYISITNRRLDLDRVMLSETNIDIQDFGLWVYVVDTNYRNEQERLLSAAQEMLNTGCWEVTVGQLDIHNSAFKFDRVNRPRDLRGIDYNHIGVTDVNLDFRDLSILEDTIFTRIKSFSASEQCGFQVLSLMADAHISPVKMEFSNTEDIL